MSSGPNQHYLPRFLQKPFGIRPKRKEIWFFARDADPKPERLKDVGAADYFYSDPAPDGARTLDDEITDLETPISRMLADVRAKPKGFVINSTNAATIVNHLVPRTAHVRVSMERGLRIMAHGIDTILHDDNHLQAIMGLDEDEPNDVFRKNLADKLDEFEALEALNLPKSLVQRIAFFTAKENFTSLATDVLPTIRDALKAWVDTADSFVRDGHNKALSEISNSTPRLRLLERLRWTILPAPDEGAILPDCVALAVDRSGQTTPAMFADLGEIAAIILPVTPDKLLVGATSDCDFTLLPKFNEEAARNSHDFFLAPAKNEYFERLHGMLGECSMQLIEESVRGAIEPYLAMVPKPKEEATPIYPLDIVGQSNEPWQYELSLIGCGDAGKAQELSKAIQGIVASLARALPLHRLDGITVASDYRGAVHSVERGYEGASAPETAPKEIGQGIARTISVRREGCWKERLILDAGIAFTLLSNESETVERGLYILISQLAEVAIAEMIERHFPGVWMQSIDDPLQGFLYSRLHPAIFSYLGSHISAGFGDAPQHTDVKRELFITALGEMKSSSLAARLDYRYDGDLDRLLEIVMPRISYTLQFGADLLGHCAASGFDPFDSEGELSTALENTGLQHWFPNFQNSLERLRMRLGRWETFDEFLALNIHVERLMWQLGLLPWLGPDGPRVEIPLGTDIAELLKNENNQ